MTKLKVVKIENDELSDRIANLPCVWNYVIGTGKNTVKGDVSILPITEK